MFGPDVLGSLGAAVAMPRADENGVSMEMHRVALAVVRRAREEGYVRPQDVRDELKRLGHPANRWKEAIQEAGSSLTLRNGRYYYVSPLRARLRSEHQHRQGVKRAARELIRRYKAANVHVERRNHRRIHFILPVRVITSGGKEYRMVSQDISLNGVRVVGAHSLRGQKVRLMMPSIDNGGGQWDFTVHFLWSSPVGDNLVESGGIFLKINE